jgi:hypothetical protein
MSDFGENVGILQQFLAKLSWIKLTQLIALILIISVAWSAFSARDQIFDYVKKDKLDSHPPAFRQLSPSTIKEINASASKSDIVAGVSVNVVNFRKNSKYIVFLEAYDKDMKEIFAKYSLQDMELPVFTQSIAQNRLIVDLINGEFVCNSYTSTGLATEMPEAAKYAVHVCSSGIPPYYGKFIGSVHVFLKRTPTVDEVDQLRVLVKHLSTIVFEKELR